MNTREGATLRALTVREVMARNVVTFRPELPVPELAVRLTDEGITGAPVLDARGDVVGVVSQSDIVRAVSDELADVRPLPSDAQRVDVDPAEDDSGISAFFTRPDGQVLAVAGDGPMALLAGGALDAMTVRDIMMPARFSVRPTTTIAGLARYLVDAGVHRALVMDEDRLLGIVTAFDVLRLIADLDRGAAAPTE